MSDSQTKWQISLFSMCLFLLVTNSATYKLTNSLIGGVLDENDKVTTKWYLIHVVVFLLLVRYSMELNLFHKNWNSNCQLNYNLFDIIS